MTAREWALLFLLAALWGASFLFIRVAAPVLNPGPLVELRVAIAALALLLYGRLANLRFEWRRHWRRYLILGALNAAIPFTLVALATLTITASLAAILNATTPLFTALLTMLWLKEPLTTKKLVGLISGMVGVSLVVGWSSVPISREAIVAVIAALLAPCSYAFAGVYAKTATTHAAPLALATGQQVAAALWLLPLAVATLPEGPPAVPIVGAVLALALLSTAVGYVIFFKLIARVGATTTLSVTFLAPVFGVVWGALLLDEAVTITQLLGLAAILAGLVQITDARLRVHEP